MEKEIGPKRRNLPRGARSLNGLSMAGFQASLDEVLEGRVSCPLAQWVDGTYEMKGRLRKHVASDLEPFRDTYQSMIDQTGVSRILIHRMPYAMSELLRQFSRERLVYISVMGQAYGSGIWRILLVPAYDAEFAITLFAAIWPQHWESFAAKHFDGYTINAVAQLQNCTNGRRSEYIHKKPTITLSGPNVIVYTGQPESLEYLRSLQHNQEGITTGEDERGPYFTDGNRKLYNDGSL